MTNECYVVVRVYTWEKDKYIMVYQDRKSAEEHRDQLNEAPYDPDELQDYTVWTLPFTPSR